MKTQDQKLAFETLIANLEKAVFDRESVTIGGGVFSPDEIKAALNHIKNMKP